MNKSFFMHACVIYTYMYSYESCHTHIHTCTTHTHIRTHTHAHTHNKRGSAAASSWRRGGKEKEEGKGGGGTHAEPTSIFRKMANLGQFLVKFKALWQKSPQKLCTIVKKISELIKTALFRDCDCIPLRLPIIKNSPLLSFAEYCLFYRSLLQKRPII